MKIQNILFGTLVFQFGLFAQSQAASWPLESGRYSQTQLIKWGENKRSILLKELEEGKVSSTPFYIPKTRLIEAPTDLQIGKIQKTIELYFKKFGQNKLSSLIMTGVETANPLSRDLTYRWNSIHDSGIDRPEIRVKIINQMKNLGILNLRLGMNNHKIKLDDDTTWKETDEIIEDFAKAGIGIVLDLHHFGIEEQFLMKNNAGIIDHTNSFYLNPKWPEYFANFAVKAYLRYEKQIKAVTIMNEPETVAGFNGEMWHGGAPGWGDSHFTVWYISRAFQIAKATLLARIAIEEKVRALNLDLPLIIQTEALVYKPDWIHYNRVNRYFTSDLIFSQNYILETDFEKLKNTKLDDIKKSLDETPIDDESTIQWTLRDFVMSRNSEAEKLIALTSLSKRYKEIQMLHEKLKNSLGLSMYDRSVFGVDYYTPNEFKTPDGLDLSKEPQHYGEQRNLGLRYGFDSVAVDYFKRFPMAMMGTESGTPYYGYGQYWHEQMLLETSILAQSGLPILGYTMYPVIDTFGWQCALSCHSGDVPVDTGGLADISGVMRPFVENFINSVKEFLSN